MMIKEALEYIVGLGKPNTLEVGGYIYTDKAMNRVDYDPEPKAIKTNTLTSILEYITSNVDGIQEEYLLIHVESPTSVYVADYLDRNMKRRVYIAAEADIPNIVFGKYVELEKFKIMLASCFADSDKECETSKETLLSFLADVQLGSIANYGDNGIAQKAVVQKGLAGKQEVIVPNPVELCPYRSFLEVHPVKSKFIFRMKEEDGVIHCALFEADGGMWKNDCRREIAGFLMDNLKDLKDVHVLY